jgi:hypothetical protein
MRREELLTLVERLGREFRRRGMDEHLRPLRIYYLALRHGLTGGKLEVSWSAQHTLDWLQTLRLPPFEDALPVRPERSPCPKCGWRKAGGMEATLAAVRRLEFPGGARSECLGCGERWLETLRSPDRP